MLFRRELKGSKQHKYNRSSKTVKLSQLVNQVQLRSYFHFDLSQRVAAAVPFKPCDTGEFCTMVGEVLPHFVVDPIQVGFSTKAVPPASLAFAGTRGRAPIVVAVTRAECSISTVAERISCNKDGTYLRICPCSIGACVSTNMKSKFSMSVF